MLKRFFILLILLFSIFFSAEAISLKNAEWGISINTTPETPKPGDYIFTKVKSYSTDLQNSLIQYFVNEKKEFEGIGETYFGFKLPDSVQTTTFLVKVINQNGKIYQEKKVFRPMNVDLVYETDGYKPIFYKGKAEAVSQVKIKFYAFPDFYDNKGNLINKKTLIYNWYVNDKKQEYSSGFGKDSFEIKKLPGFPLKTKIEVKVRSLDGKLSAVKALKLEPNEPKIALYYEDSIYPFNFKNIVKRILKTDELNFNILAVPYFSDIVDINSIIWEINSNRIYVIDSSNILKLTINRNEKMLDKVFNLKFRIKDSKKFLQDSYAKIFIRPSDKREQEKIEEIKKNEINKNKSDTFTIDDFLNI